MADFPHPPTPVDYAVPLATIQKIVAQSKARLIDLSQPNATESPDASIIFAHETAPETTMTRVYSDQVKPYLQGITALIRPDLAGQLPVVISHEPSSRYPFSVETVLGYALRYIASANPLLRKIYTDGKNKARALARRYQANRTYVLEDIADHFSYPDGSFLEPLICAAVVDQNALNRAIASFAQEYPEGTLGSTPELAVLNYLEACLVASLAPIIQSSTEPSIEQIIKAYADFFVPDHPIEDKLLEAELERIPWSAFGDSPLGNRDKQTAIESVLARVLK